MRIRTTRFGLLEIDADDVIHFPTGLVGLEDCTDWVLLADAETEALGWLQSTTRPEVAFAVVSPRRFVANYQFRVYRSELNALKLDTIQQAQVLVIVAKHDRGITLNLKAPVVINPDQRCGRQIVANDDHPVQYELTATQRFKKSA